mgnify:CR=1 FL=1
MPQLVRTLSKERLLTDEELKLDGANRQHARDQSRKDAVSRVMMFAIYIVPIFVLIAALAVIIYWLCIGQVDRAVRWIEVAMVFIAGIFSSEFKRLLGS